MSDHEAQDVCPSCRATIAATDAFCETCGATLQADALPAPTPPPGTPAAAPDEPGSSGTTAPHAAPAATLGVCVSCGGQILDDGFCGTCGQKMRSARDHWDEHPSDWIGGVCDRGLAHARNEDAMALASTPDRTLGVLVVCDGVTTAPDSDKAALAAARAACAALLAGGTTAEADAAVIERASTLLVAAAAEANSAAVGVAHTLGNPPEPPSCTFVAALIMAGFACVGWCGDSRAYWLPDIGEPERLTVDHSLGTQLIADGMSPADAEANPTSHTITRWLGADSVDPTPEVVAKALDAPGWVLLCSDGLWNDASAASDVAALVQELAARDPAPVAIAAALVDWANARGGHDNITAALARIDPSVR